MANIETLLNKIFKTINKISFFDRKRKITYRNIKLYPSEIHLLMFLYQIQDSNITSIAEQLGLTKGAISQTISRLENKGVIEKRNEPHKKNQLHIEFSPKGNILMKHILDFRRSLEKQFVNFLQSKSDSERQTISEFLDIMVSILNHKKI